MSDEQASEPRIIREQIQISYEDLFGLMQGKKLTIGIRLHTGDIVQVAILSPLEGVYLTPQEIDEIKLNENARLINLYK